MNSTNDQTQPDVRTEVRTTPILTTKLYRPPITPDLIRRDRLLKHLESNWLRPLTLISAPAGYGKSVLARMYRDTYMKHQLKPVVLSTVIADSGSMISYIVPWNVHGAFVIGALGVGLAYAPYAFLSYLSPLVTIILAFVYLNKKTLLGDEDAEAVYGTEPEDADLPAPQLSA